MSCRSRGAQHHIFGDVPPGRLALTFNLTSQPGQRPASTGNHRMPDVPTAHSFVAGTSAQLFVAVTIQVAAPSVTTPSTTCGARAAVVAASASA